MTDEFTPFVVTGLSLVATAVAGVLAWQAVTHSSVLGCGGDSACVALYKSRWARIGPVPVAGLGFALYLALFVASVAACFITPLATAVRSVQLLMSVIAAGAAVWFMLIQLLIVRRVCAYCTVLHGIGLSLAAIVLGQNAPSAPELTTGRAMSWGLPCVASLVALQILIPPKGFRVVSVPTDQNTGQSASNDAVEQKPERRDATAESSSGPVKRQPHREVSLLGGRLKLALDDWPLLGSPGAARIIAVLFDVTCEDCRHVHRLLQKAVAERPDDLAVLAIPVPLNQACNPVVRQTSVTATFACEFARLCLALWQADTEAFPAFDTWLMAMRLAPPFHDARTRAYHIVDSLRFNLAFSGNLTENRLREAIEIFRASQTDTLPQLLLPNRVVFGRVNSLKDLLQVIDGG